MLKKYIFFLMIAGWSSSVAREAHNLEATGSNPVPAIFPFCTKYRTVFLCRFFLYFVLCPRYYRFCLFVFYTRYTTKFRVLCIFASQKTPVLNPHKKRKFKGKTAEYNLIGGNKLTVHPT